MFEQQVTFLYSTDLAHSTAFYRETMALPLVLDQGGCQIFRVSRDSFLGICQCADGASASTDGIIVTLEHVYSRHARILKKRAIEPITWIIRVTPID
jgi:hypothetical protein